MLIKDECFICRATAWSDPSGESLQVNPCDRCEQYICGNHAECDYSLEGDPGHWVCTQWVCESRIECLEAN